MSKLYDLLLLMYLSSQSLEDHKTGKINLPVSAAAFILCISSNLFLKIRDTYDMLFGALIGIFILIIAYAGEQNIGYGDGILFIVTGCFLGIRLNFILLIISMLIAFFSALLLMLLRKKGKGDLIAFAPFILCAFIIIEGFIE